MVIAVSNSNHHNAVDGVGYAKRRSEHAICLLYDVLMCHSVTGDSHELRAVEETIEEANRRTDSDRERLRQQQEDIGKEMKKAKESLTELETGYASLISLIHKHREEQVSCTNILSSALPNKEFQ